MQLIGLGDLDLTLPAAAGLGAMLLACGAQRAAWRWCVLFACGVGLVAASKIAFMGWGHGWPALSFKALSGHATGVTAVYPTLLFVLLHDAGHRWQQIGLLVALGLAAIVALQLAVSAEHSVTEALAGWILGAAVSLSAVHRLAPLPALPPPRAVLAFCMTFMAAALAMQWAPFGYWMIKAARLLSGRLAIFPL